MDERNRALLAPSRTNPQQRHVEHAGLTWLDLIEPTVAQIVYLREHYGFDPLALEDVLSQIQRPKLDTYAQADYLFLVLHFAILDKNSHVAGAAEVDIFAGRDYVITSHDGSLKPLRRMFTAAGSDEHARAQLMGRGSGYLLYRIGDALVKQCFPMVDRVDEHLVRIEARAFGPNARRAVRELAIARRDNSALRHILQPDLSALRLLEEGDLPFLQLNQATYFGDLADGLTALLDVLQEQREIIEGLNLTLDSMAFLRIDEAVRMLTVVVSALLPVILVASILGMHIPLSFDQPALPIALLVMIGLAAGVVAYIRYKQRGEL
jgi:magnesium transporter